MYEAHVRYGYTLKEIGDQAGVHYATVSRIIKKMCGADV
jgi:DNA-binding MarR family transcriptional regulator